ncbi:unnamed protein product [Sphagnum troendelagicum]|uniref:Roadblock/LAMTOR2 domain-containing protein n=1 Tax=Sphagnum troendelagicum TaxID=128251 RepID=A0ABP0TU84_9BRYO
MGSSLCTGGHTDVEIALKRILSFKDVIGLLLIDADGNILRSTLAEEEEVVKYAQEIPALVIMSRSAVREIDPKNDLKMLRIKSKKHEIMVVVDPQFTLMIIHEYPGHYVEPPPPPPPPKDSDDDYSD